VRPVTSRSDATAADGWRRRAAREGGSVAEKRPNILLLVSDQERQRDWLPSDLVLPARQRLLDTGLEFRRFYTHTSPCSPSRATLFTGQYVPRHGVNENIIHPVHQELEPTIPTIGHEVRRQGYRTSYLGKWHLSHSATPDMEAYGFSDWSGNDRAFMGWAGTGVEFDPMITDQAVDWLSTNAGQQDPWFLTVALVNPHDVMWFPIDQPEYRSAHPDEVRLTRSLLEAVNWKQTDVIPAFGADYDEWFDTLPANFDDDLFTKPEVHRQWRYEQQHALYGTIDPTDTRSWLRQLDYYVKLHQLGDENLGRILDALDASGRADDTIVIFTSDHGDMCGSHGLRSKGPFLYEEIMRIPLYVRVPGVTRPGTVTEALASHVDLASTIPLLAGADEVPASMQGVDLRPVLTDTEATVRDHILFAQDSAWYERCITTRYAMRGVFDGRYKYARYYGVGGSTTPWGTKARTPKLFDVDADFADQDHELYDLDSDPFELVNLANDRAHRGDVRDRYAHLLEIEAAQF
jgi:arylsulfatase